MHRYYWLTVALLSTLSACEKKKSTDPTGDTPPNACVLQDESSKVVQCFESVGATVKESSAVTCEQFEAAKREHREGQPCPAEGRVGRCTRHGGTEEERSESCYSNLERCQERCSGPGVFTAE